MWNLTEKSEEAFTTKMNRWKHQKDQRYYEAHKEQILTRQKNRYHAMKNETYMPKPPFNKKNIAKQTIILE